MASEERPRATHGNDPTASRGITSQQGSSTVACRDPPRRAATAMASNRGAAAVACDPLVAKYTVRHRHLLGSGADGGVVRGIDRSSGELRALKYMSSRSYSPEQEVELLTSLPQHANVINIIDVFPPCNPRRHLVMVMPEADFNLHDYLQRSKGRSRITAGVLRDLGSQMLRGLQHLQHHGVVHRDIKPHNILLDVVAPCHIAGGFPSGLKLMFADFSRARKAPARRRLRVKTCFAQAFGHMMTTNVCTLNYCAPEGWRNAQLDDEEGAQENQQALYGFEVGIWSFGPVL